MSRTLTSPISLRLYIYPGVCRHHLHLYILSFDVTHFLYNGVCRPHLHLYILNSDVITTIWLSERNRIHWKTNWTLTSQLAFVYHMYNSDITTFTNAFWTLTSQPCLYWTLMSKPARVPISWTLTSPPASPSTLYPEALRDHLHLSNLKSDSTI
jgi:hypothetical protein